MSISRSALALTRKGLEISQTRTIISGPPTNRVPLPVKIAHMAVMGVSLLAVPLYVACNIKNYRGNAAEP